MSWDIFERIRKAKKPEELQAIREAIVSRFKTHEPSEMRDITETYKKQKGGDIERT